MMYYTVLVIGLTPLVHRENHNNSISIGESLFKLRIEFNCFWSTR